MMESLMQAVLGGSMRVSEAIMSSGPTLLVGLFIAAVFRYFLGTEGTRRLFGGDSLRSLPQSWAIGMLLPVCSIGVLPILLEMRRSRIKAGAMSAFALSAPLFNPLSLLYGLTLSRPYVIVMFAFGSLAVVTLVGLIWDTVSKNKSAEEFVDTNFVGIAGVQRLMATAVYMSRQLCGPAGIWALVGAMGMFALAAFLPWGALQHGVNRDDWWAPARMAFVAIPAYATPMLIMSQLGMMFQHANSPGAAFVLLVLGAGMNFGTIGWLGRHFGIRSVVTWFSCLLLIVVSIAYAINRPLIPPGVDPSAHTHAFDLYSNPIHHLDSASGSFALEKIKEKMKRNVEDVVPSQQMDQNRFEQEIIYYIEKLDINEEKVRLAQHCKYFNEVLSSDILQKGKKLGFIAQEMGREINTLGAKAQDKSIQQIVVSMKDELEKIKEQLFNVV